MNVIGIDPGATGGIFAVDSKNKRALMLSCSSVDVETVQAIEEAVEFLHESVDVVMLEKVHAFPGQGVSSVFTFGERFGVIKGAVIALSLKMATVHPKTWQKEFSISVSSDAGTPAQRKKQLKNKSYDTARSLYPSVEFKKDQADAVMLAEYALRRYGK